MHNTLCPCPFVERERNMADGSYTHAYHSIGLFRVTYGLNMKLVASVSVEMSTDVNVACSMQYKTCTLLHALEQCTMLVA